MQLTREALLARLATEVAAAGSAWVTGLDSDELRSCLARRVPVDPLPVGATAAARGLLVVSARAVAADGAVTPVGPRDSWPTEEARAACARAVAVILPTSGSPPGDASADAPLVVGLEPADSVSLSVSMALTAVAVVELDREGFIVTELAKDLSAAQLQQSVEPTLRISPAIAEMAAVAQPEPA